MTDVLDDISTSDTLPRVIEQVNAQKARMAGSSAAIPTIVTADYTVPASAGTAPSVIIADATSGPVQVTLPAANGDSREVVVVKGDSSGNAVTVVRAGSDAFEIYGSGGCALAKQGDRLHVRDYLLGAWTVAMDLSRQVRTVTTSGNILDSDDLILVDASGGSVTLTFLNADATPVCPGRAHGPTIKLIDDNGGANTLSVLPASGGEIDDLGVDTAYVYAAKNDVHTFRGDGSQIWRVA